MSVVSVVIKMFSWGNNDVWMTNVRTLYGLAQI